MGPAPDFEFSFFWLAGWGGDSSMKLVSCFCSLVLWPEAVYSAPAGRMKVPSTPPSSTLKLDISAPRRSSNQPIIPNHPTMYSQANVIPNPLLWSNPTTSSQMPPPLDEKTYASKIAKPVVKKARKTKQTKHISSSSTDQFLPREPVSLTEVYQNWYNHSQVVNYAKPAFAILSRLLSVENMIGTHDAFVTFSLGILEAERGRKSIKDWVSQAEVPGGEAHLKAMLVQALEFANQGSSMTGVTLPSHLIREFRLMSTSRATSVVDLVKEFDEGWNGGTPLAQVLKLITLLDKEGKPLFHENFKIYANLG